MEKFSSADEERILRFLEGKLDPLEASETEERIQNSEAWKEKFEELKRLHQLLTSQANIQSPSKNFTARVMAGLHALPAVRRISPRNGLLLLGGILVAIAVAVLLLQSGLFDSDTVKITVSDYYLKKVLDLKSIPTVSVNGKLLVRIILLTSTVIAFALLDRTVLKPIFGNRFRTGM
jgi:hypothetical protein